MVAITVAVIAAISSVITAVVTVRLGPKVRHTHKQVTENHHSNEQPTILDLLSDLRSEMRSGHQALGDQVSNLTSRFDTHLTHSDALERRLIVVEARDAT